MTDCKSTCKTMGQSQTQRLKVPSYSNAFTKQLLMSTSPILHLCNRTKAWGDVRPRKLAFPWQNEVLRSDPAQHFLCYCIHPAHTDRNFQNRPTHAYAKKRQDLKGAASGLKNMQDMAAASAQVAFCHVVFLEMVQTLRAYAGENTIPGAFIRWTRLRPLAACKR